MRKHYRLSDSWNLLMNGLVPHEGETWVADLERGISPAILILAFAAKHRIPEHRVLCEEILEILDVQIVPEVIEGGKGGRP